MSIALHYSFRKIDHEVLCDDNEIPEDSVEQVYLKACDLEKFPDWLMRLKNLTHINISSNAISQVPSDIHQLENLNYLDLSDNHIMELPSSFFELEQLKYLDLSGNFLDCLSAEIKKLRNLELLNFDRNFLLEIPEELTQCTNVFQLSFDECSRLFVLPKNLFSMPKLVSASFMGCNLLTIPAVAPSNLCHLSLHGNQLLNCVPHDIFMKFVPNTLSAAEFYMIDEGKLGDLHEARTNFIKNSTDSIKHIALPNGNIATIPQDLTKIFYFHSSTSIVSLRELCMRRIMSCSHFKFDLDYIPRNLRNMIVHPTALCQCRTLIFSEAHSVFFYEKIHRNPYLSIVKYFCSSNCLNTFCEENKKKIVIIA